MSCLLPNCGEDGFCNNNCEELVFNCDPDPDCDTANVTAIVLGSFFSVMFCCSIFAICFVCCVVKRKEQKKIAAAGATPSYDRNMVVTAIPFNQGASNVYENNYAPIIATSHPHHQTLSPLTNYNKESSYFDNTQDKIPTAQVV